MGSAARCINAATRLFRKAKLPVILIEHEEEACGLIPGDPSIKTIDAIDCKNPDLKVVKRAGDAFHNTNLETYCRKQGIDSVIVTGYCAEYCVLSTCRGAENRGLNPVLLRGALASSTPERIPFVEQVNEIISLDILSYFISAL